MPLTASDIPGIPKAPLIAVGSRNQPKLEAARLVFLPIWPEATIVAAPVPSGVGDQPWTDEEAAIGAVNRARGALLAAGADIGVGLEGGVEEGPGGLLYLSGWGAVVTADGRLGVGGGARTLLPPELAEMLRSGVELGPAIDSWLGRQDVRHQEGTVGVLTGGHLSRAASFANLLLHALAPVFHPEWYGKMKFPSADDLTYTA
jgi:inosine/xanthosine triphosphatase